MLSPPLTFMLGENPYIWNCFLVVVDVVPLLLPRKINKEYVEGRADGLQGNCVRGSGARKATGGIQPSTSYHCCTMGQLLIYAPRGIWMFEEELTVTLLAKNISLHLSLIYIYHKIWYWCNIDKRKLSGCRIWNLVSTIQDVHVPKCHPGGQSREETQNATLHNVEARREEGQLLKWVEVGWLGWATWWGWKFQIKWCCWD